MEDRDRPPYSSSQEAPIASAARTIARIGVMPMPPATKR